MAHSLDEWMRENAITDAALAARVGVSRPFMTRIRLGQRQPSLPIAAKLADETKLPVTTFLTPTVSAGPPAAPQDKEVVRPRPAVAFQRTPELNGGGQ